MKKIYLAIALATASVSMAQTGSVGVNTDSPKATLEIVKPSSAAASDAQGVIIPKATVSELDAMTGVATSTLIFVEDTTFPQSATTTKKVDSNGFYYFNSTEWVKVGGPSEPAKTIKVISTGIKVADWANNQYALVHKTSNGIELPDPATNKDRIISVCNQHNASVGYTLNAPANNSALFAGKGHILMSDGTKWYTIGGSY